MKFETKNKPELFSYSDGGASFEWLIDKLRAKNDKFFSEICTSVPKEDSDAC